MIVATRSKLSKNRLNVKIPGQNSQNNMLINGWPDERAPMSILPLFPFKAWVLVAFPFYLLFHSYSSGQHVRQAMAALADACNRGLHIVGGHSLDWSYPQACDRRDPYRRKRPNTQFTHQD